MARGFISGAVWGAVVGALALVVVSQIVMPPPRGAAPTPAPEAVAAVTAEPVAPPPSVPPPPAPDAEPAKAEPAQPVADPAEADTAEPPAPAAPQAPAPVVAEPTPAAAPVEPQASSPTIEAPEQALSAPAAATGLATPAPAPTAEVTAPKAPALETDPAPQAPEASAAEPTVAASDTPPSDTPPSPVATPATLEIPAGGTADADLPQADAAPVAALAKPLPEASDAEGTPAIADLPPPPPLTADEEALLVPTPIAPPNPAPALIVPETPETEPVEAPAPAPSEIGEPLVLVPDAAPPSTLAPDAPAGEVAGVRSDRLPRIGIAPAADPAPATPLGLFARPFENPAQKPLFAILLLDTGGPNVDRTSLANLPFPVSFVIDPAAPDAQTAAQIYRAAGQEVLMLATGIPKGATAADLEQTFQTNAAALPEAVAVVDLPEGGFQEDRPLASLVVPVVAAQGRGLITFDRGLNAGDQVARREDLPSATVFRRLDAEGESIPVIRRYLDRAAFKAAQEGRVVVQGTTRPETVQALLEWTVEGRAGSVELAPASAVLQVK